jgi:hypothetical protein
MILYNLKTEVGNGDTKRISTLMSNAKITALEENSQNMSLQWCWPPNFCVAIQHLHWNLCILK